jgi:CheY-like chemotaxis protein
MILDLAMPVPESLEALRLLREENTALRVLAISGQFSELLHAAQLLDANATLRKPIRPDVFLETVERLLTGDNDNHGAESPDR